MFNRIVFCLVLACAMVAPVLAVENVIVVKQATKAGSLTLAPGTYEVKVKGSLVFFVDPKSQKSMSTVATIEKTATKSDYTTVEGPVTDGSQHAQAIVLQGADYRIVFGH